MSVTTIGRRTCNYINIPECSLNQKCLSNNILYQANFSTDEDSETEVYYGICETTFKLRTQITRNCLTTETASQILRYVTSFGK